MNKQGFTLIELLIFIAIIAVLAALLLTKIFAARQKANLTGAQVYVRSVATQLEAKRDPSTGALNNSITTCMTGYGAKPQTVTGCTIAYRNSDNDFTITAELNNAGKTQITYASDSGAFSFQ